MELEIEKMYHLKTNTARNCANPGYDQERKRYLAYMKHKK